MQNCRKTPHSAVFAVPLQAFSFVIIYVDQTIHTYPPNRTGALWVITRFPRVYAERTFGVGRHIPQVGGCKGSNKRALWNKDTVRWVLLMCSNCRHCLHSFSWGCKLAIYLFLPCGPASPALCVTDHKPRAHFSNLIQVFLLQGSHHDRFIEWEPVDMGVEGSVKSSRAGCAPSVAELNSAHLLVSPCLEMACVNTSYFHNLSAL